MTNQFLNRINELIMHILSTIIYAVLTGIMNGAQIHSVDHK